MKRFMLVAALMVDSAGAVFAQEDPAGSWAFEASAFNFARGGCATDGTYMYLFGGYQRGVSASYPSYYRRARRYDPAANAWITLANLPILESGITYQYNAGAHFNGRLYSFGTSYQDGNGVVLSYSIANDAWTALSGVALPENRWGAAAATLGSLVYVSGGFAGTAPSRRTDAFDPSDNSFTRVADLPAGFHRHAMVAVPSRISVYAIGGESGGVSRATCYEYSPAADAWTERAPMEANGTPQPRTALAAFVLQNRIYVTGGHTGSSASATVLEYLPIQDSWTRRASMASTRYQHGAVAIGGLGYVYGGLPGYTQGEEYTPPYFGPAPQLESAAGQFGSQPETSLQAQGDPAIRDGWSGRMISFRAAISDPDVGQQVRLRVRIGRPFEPVWTELDSGLVAQGIAEINYSLPTQSDYDWEYRIEDAEGNSYPEEADAWLPAFGNDRTPDLRCNWTLPRAPTPLFPVDADVSVGDPDRGEVAFTWSGALDDGPGLVCDIEIARADLEDLEAAATAPAEAGQAAIRLSVSRENRYWRVRARDLAGNSSPWSAPLRFRVGYDDSINHAAGDGWSSCGYGAGPGGPSGIAALLALAAAAGSLLNARRRTSP